MVLKGEGCLRPQPEPGQGWQAWYQHGHGLFQIRKLVLYEVTSEETRIGFCINQVYCIATLVDNLISTFSLVLRDKGKQTE